MEAASFHKLYEYNITENRLEGDRFIIEGHHQKCEGDVREPAAPLYRKRYAPR